MEIWNFAGLPGGLVLFLYGMHLIEEGLTGAVGDRLKHLLAGWTDTRGKAVAAGMCATALMQSSSVTTVMVVGFVDSGILSLHRAACVIMGANIGTCATSWIYGFDKASRMPFIAFFAIAGIGLQIWGKGKKFQDAGEVLIGFAVLLFGMDMMGRAVRPLADRVDLAELFSVLENPFAGVAAGTVLTAAIQSSSASIGILQTLCQTGTVSLQMAVPFIMGQNIGTCVTALLSCVGAGESAKRAAFLHLYFNSIATAVFLVMFLAGGAVLPMRILTMSMDGLKIAVVHSLFNVGAVALLLPFSEQLVKLTGIYASSGSELSVSSEDSV